MGQFKEQQHNDFENLNGNRLTRKTSDYAKYARYADYAVIEPCQTLTNIELTYYCDIFSLPTNRAF